jgi:hypothetical protein
MAQVTQLSRHLQLQFQVGTTGQGLPKIKNLNYTHVSPVISDDDLLAVGQALAALFADPIYQIARVDQDGLAASSSPSTGA